MAIYGLTKFDIQYIPYDAARNFVWCGYDQFYVDLGDSHFQYSVGSLHFKIPGAPFTNIA